MHNEILTPAQAALLPFIKKFRRGFYLVGGTAIALQLGHRRSVDFDLFINAESLNLKSIQSEYKKVHGTKKVLHKAFDQLHVTINDVKITFFAYPYPVHADVELDTVCRMPDLLELSAMKAFALGGRAKWKEYVDLYFVLKSRYSVKQISDQAEELFGDLFSPKLLRQQLAYFDDVDYSEEVEFIGKEVSKEEVQRFLIEAATEKF